MLNLILQKIPVEINDLEVFYMLKSTGMVRQVDELGRVVIPIELRRNMGMKEKDGLEIFTDGKQIVMQKYRRGCSICGNAEDRLRSYGDIMICPGCAGRIAQDSGKQAARR